MSDGFHSWFVAEHRLVMEAKLGRALVKGERVRHRNGMSADNRPDNLVLTGLFSEEAVCPKCGTRFVP